MYSRIPITTILRGLIKNLSVESGLSDGQIAGRFNPSVAPKTLWRLRNNPPETITSQQLLLLARLLEATTGIDASNLFQHVRHPLVPVCSRLKLIAAAEVFGHSLKSRATVKILCDHLAKTARHIRLFDRGNSFAYLMPPRDGDDSALQCSDLNSDRTCNAPEISITITHGSLEMRQRVSGDEAVESLIDHVERDADLTIVNDSPRNTARIRSGILEDAMAAAVIDNRVLFVLPNHGRAVRCYRAERSSIHLEVIQSAIDHLDRIRQFRIQLPDRPSVIALLKSHLSYRLPYGSEKFDVDGSWSSTHQL